MSGPASARSGAQWGWEQATIWPAVVRLLRVDRQFPVREKDEKAGYVLFDYVEAGRSYRGTVEIVPALADGAVGGSRVFVSLPNLSKRYEITLLDDLAKKLTEESGPAPARRAPASPAPAPPAVPSPSSPPKKGQSSDGGLEQLPRPLTITP